MSQEKNTRDLNKETKAIDFGQKCIIANLRQTEIEINIVMDHLKSCFVCTTNRPCEKLDNKLYNYVVSSCDSVQSVDYLHKLNQVLFNENPDIEWKDDAEIKK